MAKLTKAKIERWRFPDGSIKQVAHPYYPASCDNCGWQGSSEKCGTDTTCDDSDVYCPACGQAGCDTGTAAEAAERVEPAGRTALASEGGGR